MTVLQRSSSSDLAIEAARPKVAVLGAGYWGKNLVRNFATLGALAAIVDQDRSTAQPLGITYKVPTVSVDEVLSDPSIAAVAIATPAVLHHQMVKTALERSKHVFVEKPLALNLEHAEELVA